ncbi:MAG: DUF4191 domain-containing protein [Propioniciclava sp.]
MASERAKELARKQKAAMKAEKLRKKNSDDPKDWGQLRQMTEAFKRTREIDPSVTWWMLGIGLAAVALVSLVGIFGNLIWWLWVPLALLTGLLGAMWTLTRKARSAMFTRYAGQPGSAEVALQSLNKKKYTYDVAITATRELDLVHRVVGPGGIVLIGEGQLGRVTKLLTTEAQRHGQVAYGTPVTEMVLGEADDQVPLNQLQKRIEKLPKVLAPYQSAEVRTRLKALNNKRGMPVPKGPMPSPKGINRALRGR